MNWVVAIFREYEHTEKTFTVYGFYGKRHNILPVFRYSPFFMCIFKFQSRIRIVRSTEDRCPSRHLPAQS